MFNEFTIESKPRDFEVPPNSVYAIGKARPTIEADLNHKFETIIFPDYSFRLGRTRRKDLRAMKVNNTRKVNNFYDTYDMKMIHRHISTYINIII